MGIRKYVWVLCLVCWLWLETGEAYRYQRRKRMNRPVLLWHPMKTGGTSVCVMAKEFEFTKWHVEEFGFSNALNCKVGGNETEYLRFHQEMYSHMSPRNSTFSGEGGDGSWLRFDLPITKEGIASLSRISGRNLASYEPSFPPDEAWEEFRPTSLLNSLDFWNGYFHIFVLRNPVDRVFSHLLYQPYYKLCNAPATLEAVLESITDGKCVQHCSETICRYMNNQIDNFYVKHLSGSPANLTLAIKNLFEYIDFPVDFLQYKEKGLFLLQRSLHWKINEIYHERKRWFATSTYEQQYPKLYQKVADYIADDMIFYDLAMEKFRKYYVVHGGDWPVTTADEVRRYFLWQEWRIKV